MKTIIIVDKDHMASWKDTGLTHAVCYSLTDASTVIKKPRQTSECDESVFVIILREVIVLP